MNTLSEPQQNKSQAAVSTGAQKQSNPIPAFTDNRPEAIAQRKLQEAIDNSPRVQQLKGYQELANDYSGNKTAQLKNISGLSQTPVQGPHQSHCGCVGCNTVQRVKIPDTHDHKDARRYTQERVYTNRPAVSGSGRRAATCEGCHKPELMERLQVDHMVPEAFLRKLHEMYGAGGNPNRAKNIAGALQLDWTKRDELDSSLTNEAYSQSMRERFANYEVEEDLEFKGNLYEVLSDVDNLWMLCPECNGKKEKTDKLLKVDYDALNAYFNHGSATRKKQMTKYLSKWIGTDYFWDPNAAVQILDVPNSPGYSDPEEMEV
ncbi:hypothetical protein HDF26_001607 [Pedobacter cryoconitis]|uniref:Uncharacterized protein n=1 Tax=Pedobacter cryoconitis TaxID=188932 RepID=A0A7W8ZQB9_9SPHI|nr:hypothetical protein [Pedobacter cryoconitis]MBB5638236.1 hypothetical protein [Pedobacter cryoconitis]MBB6271180.1 hypothetical protein [Pedobacter cryoconitis]